jgi:hypothetical protein
LEVWNWINFTFSSSGFSVVDQSLEVYSCLIAALAFFLGEDLSTGPWISSDDTSSSECIGEDGDHITCHESSSRKTRDSWTLTGDSRKCDGWLRHI